MQLDTSYNHMEKRFQLHLIPETSVDRALLGVLSDRGFKSVMDDDGETLLVTTQD